MCDVSPIVHYTSVTAQQCHFAPTAQHRLSNVEAQALVKSSRTVAGNCPSVFWSPFLRYISVYRSSSLYGWYFIKNANGSISAAGKSICGKKFLTGPITHAEGEYIMTLFENVYCLLPLERDQNNFTFEWRF